MTVAELREAIKDLDGSMRVVVDGYEMGLEDPSHPPDVVGIRLNMNDSEYVGPHSLAMDSEKPDEQALYIG